MAERELIPSNSNKSKEQALTQKPDRPHAKPVAKRMEGKKKETALQKFAHTFLDDEVDNIGEYMVKELIVPTVKDIIINFITFALWGDRRVGSSYRDGGKRRTNYNSISTSGRVDTDRNRRNQEDYAKERRDFDVDNIVFSTREEADIVLTKLEDYMDQYDQVTVGYLYELLGESGPYTLEYYGWRNLDRARIRHVANGYALDLPRPVRLER